jgi:hypothetical protein
LAFGHHPRDVRNICCAVLADPEKRGVPPALSLLVWIPLIGLVVLYYVAFAEWKAAPNRNTNIP